MSAQDNVPRRFRDIQEQLPGLLDRLCACLPYRADAQPAIPKVAGVYLFTEDGAHLYVGRSRNCYQRYRLHTRPSSTHNSASFAFNIAKQEARRFGTNLTGTREAISAEETFTTLFTAAKERVRSMDYRLVEIDDAAVSTVFEVYAAIALGTEGDFNLFETT